METESLAWQQAIDAGEDTDGWGAELATYDFSDACMHFGVHPEEPKHCVAPAYQEGEFPVMVMLCLGPKTAPLLWSRTTAALSRGLQGITPDHSAQGQTYLDVPIWLSLGGRESRIRTLSCYLLTLRALGIRVAWSKGGRGTVANWIGVKLGLQWVQRKRRVSTPGRELTEFIEEIKASSARAG